MSQNMDFSDPINIRTATLCFLIFLGLYFYFRRPKNIPPGPIGWPLIGSLPLFMQSNYYNEHVHDLMTRLSTKYGKIFSFGLGGNAPVVVLNDFKSIKEAFQKPELSYRNKDTQRRKVTNGQGNLNTCTKLFRY